MDFEGRISHGELSNIGPGFLGGQKPRVTDGCPNKGQGGYGRPAVDEETPG